LSSNIPEGYRGIGVRIEDDMEIKEGGGVLVFSNFDNKLEN
jgi:Xaa-Pro aminopeptidase